jgi:uncharacterized protein (DUF1697 family)
MTVYISILRGINVSGHKKVPMAELKVLYEELNFKNIRSYIQSGNVVFESKESENRVLAKKIEKKIAEKFKFDVPVIIRSEKEFNKAVVQNPFLKEKNIDPEKLHITFLEEMPQQELSDKISMLDFKNDRFIILGTEIYLYCPDGYGNTKLTNTFFENKLKVTATTRNWRTANMLLDMAKSEK